MRKLLLLVSIILNLILVLAIAYRFKTGSPAVAAGEHPMMEGSATATIKPATGIAPEENLKATSHTAKPSFSWRNVESPDYKIYIANLRGLHCPESTIADIIIADVSKYYRNKLAPFKKETDNTFKFWLSDEHFYRRDPAFEKLRMQAEHEKSKLLKELLGKTYQDEVANENGLELESKDPFFQNLSKEKKEQLAEVMEKFQGLKSEVYLKSRDGSQDEEDGKALKKIAREEAAALAKIFTPDELLDYQLRFSETAQNIKYSDLQAFDATEEEFRAIAKAKLAMENSESLSDQKLSAKERSQLIKEADQNLKATLGEERFKEYRLSQNWDYRNLKNIVEKNGGTTEVARQVYALKDDLQRAVNQVRNDKSLNRAQRDEKLLAIKAETDKTLTDALGARGYKAFRRNMPWIQEIARGIEKK